MKSQRDRAATRALAGLLFVGASHAATAQVSGVRTEVAPGAFVHLQSYTMAEYDGDYMFFGGLATMGLHSLARGGHTTFPPDTFNRRIHCYDPDRQITYSATTTDLPGELRSVLVATNAQGVQFGDTFYIYGGYGPIDTTPSWTTWDTVVRVDLAPVHAALIAGEAISSDDFQIAHTPVAQVSGGGIARFGDRFALVGGARFFGNYGDEMQFVSEYSETIHIFDSNVSMVEPVLSMSDAQFHRRDGNVSLITLGSPGSTRPGFVMHIGVFKPGREILPEVWEHPIIYDSLDDSVVIDTDFTQMMNQYEAPRVSFHSAKRSENYLVTLGGLSGANWDGQQFVPNIVIPWVTDVTLLTVKNGQVRDETVVGSTLKPVTNAEFVLSGDLPVNALGQVLWDDLEGGETLLGHFFGGIEAANPGNTAQTRAGDLIYAVYATIDKLALDVSPLRTGEQATMTTDHSLPGAPVIFAYSRAGQGPTYVPSLGLWVDLSPPIVVLGQARADDAGSATITATIPANAPPIDVYLQAVTREGPNQYAKSNAVIRTIEN